MMTTLLFFLLLCLLPHSGCGADASNSLVAVDARSSVEVVHSGIVRRQRKVEVKTASERAGIFSPASRDLGRDHSNMPAVWKSDCADIEQAKDINFVLLTLNTELGRQRVHHFLDSGLPRDLRCRLDIFYGLNYKEFPDNQHIADDASIVGLSALQKQQGLQEFEHNGGAFCCAMGHFAIWKQASQFAGWTVVLEDDAMLQSGWDFARLKALLQNSVEGFAYLEPRPCTLGEGSTAYAISQERASDLVQSYDFHRYVDMWMIQEKVGTKKRCGSKDVSADVSSYPFVGWGKDAKSERDA